MSSAHFLSDSARELKLIGNRLYLRPVVESDASPSYINWLNDPETTRYLESGRVTETQESLKAYISRYNNREDALFLAIILKENDLHVGNIKLEPINWYHRNTILGIMIGAPEARGKGIGSEAILLLLSYCFDVLDLHRVGLGVSADNEAAISCYQKIGFKEEGQIRGAVRREHGYVDNYWMGITKDEFLGEGPPK